MKSLSVSEHFQLEQVGDGIYAAFAKDKGRAIANAGIVDLGNRTLVFDTFLSADAAIDLKKAASELFSRPVQFVVNSHHHADHVGGNLVFDGAEIITTLKTRQLVLEQKELEEYRDYAQTHIQKLQTTNAKEIKLTRKRQLEAELLYYQAIMEALPQIKLSPSTMSFDSKLVIEGSKRQVELLSYGGGHCASDALLFVPDAKLLFTGDLLTVGHHPYLADGDPGELDRILNLIIGLAPQFLIPGHGMIAEVDDVRVQRQYITMLSEIAIRELVYGATDAKDAAAKAVQITIPPTFANWEFPSYFSENLLFLYRRLLAAYAD